MARVGEFGHHAFVCRQLVAAHRCGGQCPQYAGVYPVAARFWAGVDHGLAGWRACVSFRHWRRSWCQCQCTQFSFGTQSQHNRTQSRSLRQNDKIAIRLSSGPKLSISAQRRRRRGGIGDFLSLIQGAILSYSGTRLTNLRRELHEFTRSLLNS